MHCLAYSLDSNSNKELFKIGTYLSKELDSSIIIENFHMTLICVQGGPECQQFINEYKKDTFIFRNIYPLEWKIFEGKLTDYDYLVLKVLIPKKIEQSLLKLRKELSGDHSILDFKPHISVIKIEKGKLKPDIIQKLNNEFKIIPTLKTKDLVQFDHNQNIVESINVESIHCYKKNRL